MQENLNVITAAEEINAEAEEKKIKKRTIKEEPNNDDKTTKKIEGEKQTSEIKGELILDEMRINDRTIYKVTKNNRYVIVKFEGDEVEFLILPTGELEVSGKTSNYGNLDRFTPAIMKKFRRYAYGMLNVIKNIDAKNKNFKI
jgi:hypothetical protein